MYHGLEECDWCGDAPGTIKYVDPKNYNDYVICAGCYKDRD